MKPVCSVVMATRNRCVSLRAALDCVLHQSLDPAFEVIVVDNASTDSTAAVLAEFTRRHPSVRAAFEGTRGQAAARNTGVSLAQSDLILFTDDDIRPTYTWVAAMIDAAASYPDIDCFGGRVLPSWPGPVPPWLTREHWTGALALQDYGDAPVVIGADRPRSLVTANMAIRKRRFDALGRFDPEYLLTEDTELMVRLWRSGRNCLYLPDAVVIAPVPPERMTRAYHRRWHRRNARWSAKLRLDECFDGEGRLLAGPVDGPTLFGVQAYLYRHLIATSMKWIAAGATLQLGRAFGLEKQLWQQSFYIRARMGHARAARRSLSAEIKHLWHVLGRKAGRRLFSHP